MSKHTQGSWRVSEKYPADIYANRAGHAIARAVNPQSEGECEANARRIVACVNACEGISTEQLERGAAIWLTTNMSHYEAVEQRAALLAELQNIANANPKNWDAPLNDTASFQAWAQSRARAAIAKVEGEQA